MRWVRARLTPTASACRPPNRKFSGHFALRISPALHRRLAMEAAEHGVSINKWVNEKLASTER
ncbi:type II toxin-antitoxin system HicB family antitoxin [Nocardia sp. NPDC005998]|uniref:type II toxin-antitoxin system HicB family antitoxin n=1 Tax=Nocardia sp. NPDC005998 TaxID=3156894 RepID=UPI0033B8DF07